uniref:HNH endonuclease n=1 Tax=Algoriphagus sp. TaxID=1872435 RepID=UPI00404869FE
MSFEKLIIGSKYSKKDLSKIFDNPNISLVREGIYNLKTPESFFFVDLEKEGKEERFHFDDYFEGEYFHWDSQPDQHINSPKIQEIVVGKRTPHLFVRLVPKIKNVTQPFVYCGRLNYQYHEGGTSKSIHIIFQNIDFVDETENLELLQIYFWKPTMIGGSSRFQIKNIDRVSEQRKRKYKIPNETERSGLVTSRVGQGYYRQQIIEKWEGKCPVTNSNILKILISSHIVPWSESTDEERLDVENGILLSPTLDSLFDKNLISFEDTGEMILSKTLTLNDLKVLGIPNGVKIKVTEGMKKYLKKHREKLKK